MTTAMPRDCANPGTTNPADQSYPAIPSTQAASEPASAALTSSTGEMQLRDLRETPTAEVTGRGLAAEVHAGSASQAVHIPPIQAPAAPPAGRLMHGASGQLKGGLPVNVMIK